WNRDDSGIEAGTLRLYGPKVRIVRESGLAAREREPPPRTGEIERKNLPISLTLHQIEIHDGTVVIVDETVPGKEILVVRELEISIENFSTQRRGSGGLPVLVTARGRVGKSGWIAAFATVNPWTGTLDFAGRAQLVGLSLTEVNPLLEQRVDLRVEQGQVAVFVEFSVENGRITGGAKPMLTNVDVAPADPGVLDRMKAWFAGGAFALLSNGAEPRDIM